MAEATWGAAYEKKVFCRGSTCYQPWYDYTQAVLVRWDANDRVEPPEAETESAFKLLKSKWSKSHGEGAWRLDLDHISRGRRHRTGSVSKVPVSVVPQLATLPPGPNSPGAWLRCALGTSG